MKREFKAQFPLESIDSFIYKRQIIDSTELDERKRSIHENGVVTPLIVRKLEDGTYQLLAGYMRMLASQSLGKAHVPAMVYSGMDDLTALDYSLIDNIQHSEMSDWDIAQMLNRYRDQGMKLEEIATRITKSPSYISLKLRVLKDSLELQKAVESNEVTEQQARYIRKLPEELHERALGEVTGKTVKETKEKVIEIQEDNQILILQDEIKDYEGKLTEITETEKTKEKLADEISTLEGELQATQIENKEINGIMKTVELLENDYFPVERELAMYTSELKETKKLLPDYDVTELTKDRSAFDKDIAKAQKKVEKIRKTLKDAQKTVKSLQEQRKTVNSKIGEYNERTRKVRDLTKLVEKTTEKKTKLSAKLGDKVKLYESLKATLKKHDKEVLEARFALIDKINTMKTEVYSLTGKINNRKTYEKRIQEIQAEIVALQAVNVDDPEIQVPQED